MILSESTVKRIIRSGDNDLLRHILKILTSEERESRDVCDAAKRISFPSTQRICAVHASIKSMKSRVSRALHKK